VIFVTVGGQLPFDRLIRGVDRWAGEEGRNDIFAQIGRSAFRPRHIRYTHFLAPPDFRRRLDEAEYVISHAGIGTMLTALERGKPLLVVPRQARFGESVNEHQVATAGHFAAQGKLVLALSEEEVSERFEALKTLPIVPRIPPHAPESLLSRIRAFAFEP